MSVLKRSLCRVITAMITPFNEDGTVNYDGAVALARHLVEHGSEGLLVGAMRKSFACISLWYANWDLRCRLLPTLVVLIRWQLLNLQSRLQKQE